MPNFFDQFDAPGSTATASGGNPFDRFDVQKPNQPGLISTIKRTGANMASTAATAVEDITGKNQITQGVIDWGKGVEERNPAGIQSLSDIANNPLLTIKEGVGNMVAQMPVTLGASALGAYGGGAVGGALGGPPGAAVGATIGRWAGAAIPTFLQEYGGIRQDQQEAGIDDKGRALLAAVPATAIEFNPLSPDVKAIRLMAGEEGKKLFGQGGKQVAKDLGKAAAIGAVTEGPMEEYPQSLLESWGAHKDPFTAQAQEQAAVGAVLGAVGGGAMGPINATASGIRAAKEEEARRVAAQMGVAPIAGAPASPAPLSAGTPVPAQPVAGTPATPAQPVAGNPSSVADTVAQAVAAEEAAANQTSASQPAIPVQQAVPASQEGPAPGMVRMYHGGLFEAQDAPTWFSSDRQYAEGYAKKVAGGPGGLLYVDVPENYPAIAPEYPEQSIKRGFHVNVELPADIARNAIPVAQEQDPLYAQAVDVVLQSGSTDPAIVRDALRIGYNRAASLVEQMERNGIVSPMDAGGKRSVINPEREKRARFYESMADEREARGDTEGIIKAAEYRQTAASLRAGNPASPPKGKNESGNQAEKAVKAKKGREKKPDEVPDSAAVDVAGLSIAAPPDARPAPASEDAVKFAESRTDGQLAVLAKSGRPGYKEAAVAEIARRSGMSPKSASGTSEKSSGVAAQENKLPASPVPAVGEPLLSGGASNEMSAGNVGETLPKSGSSAPVRGAVGMMLSTGQVVTTASGRTTTPFPKVNVVTNRGETATIRNVDRWLLENAALEAEARGDDFNSRPFRQDLQSKSIPQASKDSAEEYLFGEQPPVFQKITRKIASQPPVVTNETATDAPQTPLSSASETQAPRKNPGTKSNPPPIMRRDDLVGAIMRVTGGNGIHSSMAPDTVGDNANRATKLRGLFTNRGTTDLGDVAMLLRESESFDVRDGEHLSEMIRQASFGDVPVSMERQERNAEADKEKQHRDRIRAMAKKYKLKTDFVKFSVLEGQVLYVERQRHKQAVNALTERDKKRFEAAVQQLEGLVSEEEVGAILRDVNERPNLDGREKWKEARRLLEQFAQDARHKEIEGAIDRAEQSTTTEEPDWFKEDDDEADTGSGNGGLSAEDHGKDGARVQGQSNPAAGEEREGGVLAGGEEGGQGNREAPAGSLELTGQTQQEAAAAEAEAKAQSEREAKAKQEAEKAKKEAETKAEIKLRSEAAASTFELGGNAMDNLTGQGSILDAPAAPVAAEKQEEPLQSVTIGQFRHTKTGLMQYSVAFKDKVSPEIFAQAKAIASREKTRWSAFKGGGAIPGFLFASEAKARQFAAEIDKLVKPAATKEQEAPALADNQVRLPGNPYTYTKHADGRWSWAVSPAPVAKPNFLGANAEVIPKAEKALAEKRGESKQDPATAVAEEKAAPAEDDIGAMFDAAMNDVFGEAPAAPAPAPAPKSSEEKPFHNPAEGGPWHAGRAAFLRGEARKLPSYFTSTRGKNQTDWFRGWDWANANGESGQAEPAPAQTSAPRPTRSASTKPATASTPKTTRTAPASAASAIKNAGMGLADVAKGLSALFKPKPGTLGTGLPFDEDTYASAKPYFLAGVQHFKQAGADIAEMLKSLIVSLRDQFGMDRETIDNMKPYIVRFMGDVKAGKLNYDESPAGETNAQEQAGTQNIGGEGGVPEVGKGGNAQTGIQGDSPVNQPSGANPESVEGVSPANAERPGGNRPVSEVRGPDASQDVGSAGGVLGGGDALAGQPGASAEGVPDDVPARSLGNYHIADPEALIGGSPRVRFARNKAAIEAFQNVSAEGRAPTAEERDTIARFIGWGSFGQELFNGSWANPAPRPEWKEADAWLREHLGKDDWQSAQASIINAHYTDPPTVQTMWEMVKQMGFTGGRVLEPSMGIGNFFGMMPRDMMERSQLTGIEMESLTGGMAKMLYPDANIQIKPYQDSKTSDGFYDLVIGNWPFAAQAPLDRRYMRMSPTLHDYFFLKALDQVRAGGLVVGITSSGTMDKAGESARYAMARKADLIGAFRLPSGAFEKYAGTSVVTDILVFRKRADDNPNATTENWLKTKETETPQGTPVKVNAYFADNPQFVLGTTNYGHGTTRGVPGMIVDRPADLMDRLKAIPEQLPADAYAPAITGAHLSFISNHTNDRQQSIVIGQDNGLYVVNGEHLSPLNEACNYQVKDAKKTAAREAQIRALIGLRKAYASLIDSERTGGAAAESNRKKLNALYASFVQAHGAINESDGLNILKKVRDPFYPSLAALEVKGATGYRPAMILSRPTMRAAKALSDPTIEDAFVLARNKSMSLDMEALAKDAKVTVSEATKVLVDAGAIFKTPVGNYEVSDVYLSGNVRRKLHEAEAALNDGDESMAGNIAALKKVIPPDEPYYRIEAKLGAPWVSASQYRDFVSELLGVSGADKDDIKVENRMGRWVVQFENPRFNHRPEATAVWGMQAYPFSKLVRAAMNNTSVTIRVRDADGNVVVSPGLTEEANTKIGNIREHFSSWVWSDIDRRSVLEKEYNEVMRAIAAPRFDGSFLRMDGMALQRGTHEFSLRAHQTDAIWRGLVNQMGIYAHEVGTGKTYTMAGLAVESRRYGLAKKPLIFAHNANSAAVAREFQEMYPAAKVLYIDNLSPGTIGTTMRQIANDDWDAVVVPHSLIERFALTKESLDAIAAEEITLLEEEAVLAAQEDNSNLTVDMMSDEEAMKRVRSPTAKELVKARNAILARIAKMAAQSSREDAVSFEDLGVDMVIVDEAHEFKKPPLVTRMKMKGLNKGSSGMSISLRFLTDYVKQQNNGKGVHLFTGTPITNTLAEIYNMQRYVADSQMQRDGIKDWDSWFATFADSQSDVELTSTGEYDSVTRLSMFINTADLRNMIGVYTDIVFADDMPEFKPRHTDSGKTLNSEDLTDEDKDFLLNGKTENPVGRPYKKIINDVAEMTDAQRNYLQILQARATAFKNAQPSERKRMSTEGHINAPILIDNQAPAVGLDPRLFDLSAPDHPNLKINRAAKNILTHFSEDKLATQVVFVERGYVDTVERSVRGADGYPMRTPDRKPIKGTAATFNLVDALVEKLVKGGIPSGQIAIIDGRTSGKRRQEVSDAMNAGTIRVVIGMTKTLGVGVNMQKHLRALHHLDAPWMPGDLEQRNGRGQRQGNQWNTLFEYRYITDRVDGRRWQVLAIKERFIKQFLKANTETRIIDGDSVSDEDDTDIMSSLSEAAGDPRIMLRQKLKGEVERLEKRAYMHDAGRADSGRRYQTLKYDVREMERIAKKLDTDIDAAKPLLEKGKFSITIDGKEFSERQPADAAIKSFVDGMNMYHSGHNLGNIGSFKITLDVRAGQLYGTIEGPGGLTYEVRPSVASIESVLRNLHGRANNLAKEIEDKNKSIPRLLDAARAPFQRADVLAQKKKLLQQLEMDLQTNPVPPPPWLRQGAPVETLVYVNGKEYVVEGHQHGKDGFFVIIATPKGSRRLHYGMARDAQGMDLYEAHLFEPPASVAPSFKKGDDVVSKNGEQWVLLAAPRAQDGVLIVFAKNKTTGSEEELLVDVLKPAGALLQPIPIFDGSESVEPTIAASEHEQEQANQIQEAAMAGALPGERRLALLDYQDTLARNSGAMPGESRYNLATDTKSSPSDRAIYGMVAEGKTAAEILSFIGKASRRPFNRYLANALRNLGAASTLTLDSQGGWRFGNTSQAQRYAAAYNPKTDTVALFTAREAERHTLHELTHAATLKAIAAGGPASLQMRALFLHIKRNGSIDGQYGMSNLDEFVAEAFSNPKFQAALKNIPAPKSSTLRNAWEWFVRLVANALGFKTAPMRTALDEAMTVGAALMRENAALNLEGDQSTRFAIRTDPSPKKTAIAYKLFKVKESQPGKLFPLFVGANDAAEMGVWIDAEVGPITETGKVKSKLGPLAFRPGWHAGDSPMATHIGEGGKPPKYRPADQVWAEVEVADDVDWQSEANRRARRTKAGDIVPVSAQISDQIPVDGHYRYKTNPNMTGQWIITGSMKINRILSDEEVSAINSEMGVSDLPRSKPFDYEKYGFENPADATRYNVDTLPDTITINGTDRPTTNSNGKPIAQDEAGVRRFWEWFGESKVTDEKGRPLVLFHGATADFGADGAPVAFDFGRTADEDLSSGKGAYLTTSPEAASRYADGISWGNGGESDAPNVMPVYARIEAPFSKTASYRIEDFESVLPESVVEDAKNSANPGENFLEETQQAIDDLQSRLEDLQAGYLNDEIADEYRIDESDYDSEDEYQAAIEEAIEREVGDAERTIERYEGEVERAWADAKAEYSNTRLSGDEIWTAIKEDLPEYADWKNERQLFGGDSASIEMDTEVARILFDAFGFDGVKRTDKFPIKTQHTVYIANNAPTQIKSATGNSSQFDPANPDIRYSAGADWYNGPSGAPVRNAWQRAKAKAAEILSPKNLDKIIYEMQDKYVDLKRLRDHIKAIGGTITDMNDAYLGEELYHQRLAYRTEKFSADELLPLQAEMRAKGISQSELETFLHARHAPEANAEMAKRNPNQSEIDAGRKQAADAVRDLELQLQRAKATGSATHALERALNDARGELVKWNGAQAFRGTEEERTSLSGMSDAASAAILAGLTPKRRAELDALAVRVDAINEGTLQLLDDYGLMPKAALTAWRNTYQHYIPLHRDEAHPDSLSHPIGQGFNVKGDAAKRRTGSNQKVTNIIGHIAMQREAALTRGEKNHVMLKLYLMARQNPLPDVWKVGSAPTIDTIDKATGFVKSIPDPLYKTRPNVLVLRVGGKDVAITINEHNPEALRMAHALKNLDVDDLHYLIPVVGKATRWFASMNTQYNPIFGIINLMRDTQEAALNLSTTELAGKQGEILKDQLSILKEVLQNKGRMPKTGKWAAIFAELKEVGGTTGYRDLFLDAESRGKALQDTLKSLDRGKASQAAHAVADWLSDYNEAMENATRLAAYKAGIDSGMSKERAASLAKNLTVNFNRKGRQTRELGALYAFFNAAVQGTTRMAQTLAGPAGRKIMAGGVLIGALNALLGIAMMGGGDGDDDEWEKIPEFVKERSIIIPIGNQDYLSIPMPLGFQFLPNIGRLAVEMAVYKDKTAGKQMASLFTVLADAFNPLGGSSPPMQIIAPTVMDPFVSLAQNKDWTGRPIYIENRNNLDPKPGLQRSKDSATPWAKGFAEAINAITGGTEYTPGGWSPTPDQIDYVIGQLTGGVGREAGKVASTLSAPLTGEELPAHKIPLAGRLYGSTSGTSGQSERFYENITRANAAESEIKGRARDGLSVAEYLRDNPGAVELAVRGNAAEKQVSALRKMRRDAVKQGGPEATGRVRDLNERMAAVMRDFNNESGKVGRRAEQ